MVSCLLVNSYQPSYRSDYNEDIAQLNVLVEEDTTIETFSELVLTDKLTVIGGASNQLESVFSGPVTFQKKVTSQENVQSLVFTFSNDDGTTLKQQFLAEELGTGLPDVDAGGAWRDGDICYNVDWVNQTSTWLDL